MSLAAANFENPKDNETKEGKKFPIKNPLEWAFAFSTYAPVASLNNPARASALFTYSYIIMCMAWQGQPGMLLRYDRAFRQATALNSLLQWDRRDTDNYLAAESEELPVPHRSWPYASAYAAAYPVPYSATTQEICSRGTNVSVLGPDMHSRPAGKQGTQLGTVPSLDCQHTIHLNRGAHKQLNATHNE